jgi:hypothetical protein
MIPSLNFIGSTFRMSDYVKSAGDILLLDTNLIKIASAITKTVEVLRITTFEDFSGF